MKNKMNFEKLRRIIISSIVIAMIILVIWDVITTVTMTFHPGSKTFLYSLLKFTILSTIIIYAVIIPATNEFYFYESICDFIALKFVPRKVYSNKNLYYHIDKGHVIIKPYRFFYYNDYYNVTTTDINALKNNLLSGNVTVLGVVVSSDFPTKNICGNIYYEMDVESFKKYLENNSPEYIIKEEAEMLLLRNSFFHKRPICFFKLKKENEIINWTEIIDPKACVPIFKSSSNDSFLDEYNKKSETQFQAVYRPCWSYRDTYFESLEWLKWVNATPVEKTSNSNFKKEKRDSFQSGFALYLPNYPKHQSLINEIDEKIEKGYQFDTISEDTWREVYRKNILKVLSAQHLISEGQEQAALRILEILKDDLFIKNEREEALDNECTLEALTNHMKMSGLITDFSKNE